MGFIKAILGTTLVLGLLITIFVLWIIAKFVLLPIIILLWIAIGVYEYLRDKG